MSAAATYPPLLAAAQKRGSLMRALRAEVPPPSPDAPPLFWALDGGMASMVEHLRAALTARGVEIRCAAPVDRLERLGTRWNVRSGGGLRRCGRGRPRRPCPGGVRPAPASRRRSGRAPGAHRLRLGHARHLPRQRRGVHRPAARHRVPGPTRKPGAVGRRALGGDRLHLSLAEVATCGHRGRGPPAGFGRALRRRPRRRRGATRNSSSGSGTSSAC